MLSTVLPRLGKVFRMEAVLGVPVDQLYYELFEKLEQMPEWNPTLSRVKVNGEMGLGILQPPVSHLLLLCLLTNLSQSLLQLFIYIYINALRTLDRT